MAVASLSTLTVALPYWGDRREVRVGNVSASWTVSRPGRLSAQLDARTAWLLGIDNWLGLWVRWEHPTMGEWGGVIQDTAVSLGDGTVELSCASFHTLIEKRRTPRTYVQASAPAGALVLRAITDADNELPVGFDSVVADQGGPTFRLEWRGEDLMRLVQRLASASGSEWNVTLSEWAIAFEFRARVGRDQRGEVLLVEGYQVAAGRIAPSIAGLVNDLLAVSADRNWTDAPGAVATDPDSIVAYGRRQETARYAGLITEAGLAARGKTDLEQLSAPVAPVSVRLADTERQLLDIREGDTVRLWSASANGAYAFRVLGRSVNAETGIATLVGDAEAED